ncbi:MAG TPA: DNA alkylation repair protein [Candidatus Limnocylindrales bacterium]|nr:DNA alkylation repair protein [Candidatus Limnocylindrales bacterium]
MTAAEGASTSPVTARAVAFVAARRESAEAIGRALADSIHEPTEFAAELRRGLASLADPEYLAAQRLIAPGIGPLLGVRWPLNAAVARGFRGATRSVSSSSLLQVADRLLGEDALELHWFAFGLLERVVTTDPEQAWQLLRRAARQAGDWITVDSLAHPYGRGILREPFRWAELEQLVFSPSRWERRLVGSTVATIPFVDHATGRELNVAARGLGMIADLIGDDEPDVQKALAWALRSLVLVDVDAVAAFCRAEAAAAAATDDGHRAWVIRDVLARLDAGTANEIRSVLAGVRRRTGDPATSRASETRARFGSPTIARGASGPPLT